MIYTTETSMLCEDWKLYGYSKLTLWGQIVRMKRNAKGHYFMKFKQLVVR